MQTIISHVPRRNSLTEGGNWPIKFIIAALRAGNTTLERKSEPSVEDVDLDFLYAFIMFLQQMSAVKKKPSLKNAKEQEFDYILQEIMAI
jgi:hypothetical protein